MAAVSVTTWSVAAGAAASADPLQVTDADFADKVIAASGDLPVVVEFYADWCGYCRKLRPILESLAQEYDGRLHFVRVDVEADPDVAERFGVDGVPVVYVFDAGLPLARIEGRASRRDLKDMIDAFTVGP
jgi:putative thioredoxin